MADISNTNFVPSEIQRIVDHSIRLCERSIVLHKQCAIETAHLLQLIVESLLLIEEGKRLKEWKPSLHKGHRRAYP